MIRAIAIAASAAIMPTVAWAAGPEDFAKTPLEFFGAWGVSMIVMGWWNWSMQRALTAKDALIAAKDADNKALSSEYTKSAVTLATAHATTSAATNAVLEKIADQRDKEFCKWRAP